MEGSGPIAVSENHHVEVETDDEGRPTDVEQEEPDEFIHEPFDPAEIDVQTRTPTVDLLQGQSAMARLTCAAAATGAQLLVETHSDHILNGVRLAVKRQVLPPENVALHYFKREDDGIHVVSPAIGPDGMLSEWPPGFFDEWDRSLDQLLG
jgi:hypothetical protein